MIVVRARAVDTEQSFAPCSQTTARAATSAISQSPLSDDYGPFAGTILKGRKGSELAGRTVGWDVCFTRLRAQSRQTAISQTHVGKRSDSGAPDKDVQPLLGASPKRTFRRRAILTGMGGERAYRGGLGKDRCSRDSRQPVATQDSRPDGAWTTSAKGRHPKPFAGVALDHLEFST
jgi:hypothetical protein